MRISLRSAVAAVVLTVGGCQCSDEPGLSRVVPSISVGVESIDFGEVPVGATKRVFLRVENVGTADLVLSSVTTDEPFGAEVLDVTITPGSAGLIDVWFRPTSEEPQMAPLAIESNDEAKPIVTVMLTGLAIDGALTVQPVLVDFEETTVGVTKRAEVLLSNFGLETIEGRTAAERFERPEHFSLTGLTDLTSTGRFSVPARGEAILDLEYRPLELGPDSGRIVFETCGDRCGLELTAKGVGSDAAVRLDPPVLDFEVMGIGETKTLQLRVENIGNGPLDITDVSSSGVSGLLATSTRPLPFVIAAGDVLTITVELTISVAGPLNGAVVVRTSDPLVPEARATVIGEGQGPLFSVQPEAVAFGAQRSMSTFRRPLLMLNSGSTVVRVNAIRIAGDPVFGLGPIPGLPTSLAAGESLVVDVTFAPTQVVAYSGTVTVESDDPLSGMIDVPVTGALTDRLCELQTAPPSINFGVLPPTFTRRATATLTNIGTDVCTMTSGSFRAPVDPTITLVQAPWPVVLNPGESFSLEFEFAPVAQVESKANLTMLTTDPVYPERHISLAGTGQGYVDVFTDPTSLDFGSARPMCSLPARNVTLYNAGTVEVTIPQVVLTSSTSEFSFVSPATPFMLPPGGAQLFTIGYEPVDVGVDHGLLEIPIDGLTFPLVVPIQGEGSLTPRNEDVFVQRITSKVDVLFVIDDSCSMGDDQRALAQNFRNFISSANVRSVDFQIGITTTTLSPIPGDFVGPILNSQTPNLESAFSGQANVGTGGSGFERGLDAMDSAFKQAERGAGHNAGFLRSDAVRAVVIVSDEDDQSGSAPAFYFNELRRRSPNGYFTAVITGGPMGCGNGSQRAFMAPTYDQFINLTGGTSELICNTFASTLTNIGNAAFGLSRVFGLAAPADTTMPIEVYVNGNRVTQGWMYDPVANAIEFVTPPAEGSTIRVTYTPQC